MYLKNDSSPNAIYAILVNASDGSPITTGVTAYHIQGTTRTAGAGTLAHIANGRWCYVPTQAETNYDAFAIDFYHADAIGQGAIVEVVTANQGLSVITADTSAIKQRTDTYLDTTISSRAPANTALSNTVWTDAKAAFLDAAISSRLAASSYVAPDNASIAAIKSQTDKLSFVGSDVKATLDNEQVTVAVNNDKTGYSLTADYDRAKTALAITEYIAPDNASIAAIKSQTDKLSFVGTDVKATLDGEAVVVGSYATNQSPGEQIQGIGYTPTRAAKLDNLDASVSTRLAAASYVAPDNASIAAIKSQTDKLQFDASNYVYATGLGGGGSVQVVVQPLPVRIQNIAYDGGVLTGWLYSKLVASLLVQNADLTGHNLRLILFARNDPLTSVAEYSTASSEITITYNAPDSLVQINGPDTKTPPAGNYGYVLRDQSTDTVLVSGTCLIHAAPDAS